MSHGKTLHNPRFTPLSPSGKAPTHVDEISSRKRSGNSLVAFVTASLLAIHSPSPVISFGANHLWTVFAL